MVSNERALHNESSGQISLTLAWAGSFIQAVEVLHGCVGHLPLNREKERNKNPSQIAYWDHQTLPGGTREVLRWSSLSGAYQTENFLVLRRTIVLLPGPDTCFGTNVPHQWPGRQRWRELSTHVIQLRSEPLSEWLPPLAWGTTLIWYSQVGICEGKYFEQRSKYKKNFVKKEFWNLDKF